MSSTNLLEVLDGDWLKILSSFNDLAFKMLGVGLRFVFNGCFYMVYWVQFFGGNVIHFQGV